MISLFFLVMMGMSLCSSLDIPSELSEEPRAGGRFARFIEAEDYPALGSATNTAGQSVKTKRQAIGGHGSGAGSALDAIDNGLTILNYILQLPGKCCPSASKVVDGIGNWCADGTKGTPYCARGGCNIQGCNCDGGCRAPPDDSIVAIMYEGRNYNKGAFNTGADKAFTANSNTCVNFGYFNDKISSIIPTNGCVKVWENGNCEGASACFCRPIVNLRQHEMRSGTSWEDQISSMSTC